MVNQYDAIDVGARCAGARTAMLLARKGYRVLVVAATGNRSTTVPDQLVPGSGGPHEKTVMT